MTANDANPLSGASLLDLGLDEITAPDEGQDQWAAAGRALVNRVDRSLREQRQAAQRETVERQRLSERYEYQFEQDAQPDMPAQHPGHDR